MTKSLFKTLSLSFVTLASAAMLQASQGPTPDRTAGASDSTRVGCATQAEVDLGWEEQLALVEKRLAEKEAEGLLVPGAIITAPFETFPAYRTDVPPSVATLRAAKGAPRSTTDHESSH